MKSSKVWKQKDFRELATHYRSFRVSAEKLVEVLITQGIPPQDAIAFGKNRKDGVAFDRILNQFPK